MKWITRERPKIDRIACPWLIKNFIDPHAEFFLSPLARSSKKQPSSGESPTTFLVWSTPTKATAVPLTTS
jgi:hypothetical protein